MFTFVEETKPVVDLIFGLLRKNLKVLKHQFGQLNVGLKQVCEKEKEKEQGKNQYAQHCDIIEWNADIDAQFLHKKRTELNEMNQEVTIIKINVAKFLELKEQWGYIIELVLSSNSFSSFNVFGFNLNYIFNNC